MQLSNLSRTTSYSISFQPLRLFSTSTWGEGESLFSEAAQLVGVVAESGAESAECIGGTQNHGVAETVGGCQCLIDILAGLRIDGLDIYLVELLHENLAVLGIDYGLHGSTEHFHAIFVENAVMVKVDAAVEGSLASEGEENSVGAFLGDYFLHEEWSDGQEVNMVGDALAGLDGGDVGIDEHRFDAFLAKGLQGLAAGVVELAGLADFESAGTQYQHLAYLVVSHSFRRF